LPDQSLIGPGTDRPVGFTLEELVNLVWRIRSYDLSVSYDLQESFTYSVGLSGSGTASASIEKTVSSVASREIRIPYDYNTGGNFNVGTFSYQADPTSLSFDISQAFQFSLLNFNIYLFENLYYPQMGFTLDGLASTHKPSGNGQHPKLSGQLLFLGKEIQLFATGFPVYPVNYSGTLQVDATIEASAYWPYAANDGSPIYSSETGDLLQDPLS
jgi:hypothetical protein